MSWTEEQYGDYMERLTGHRPEPPIITEPPVVAPLEVSEALIEAECTKILEADRWRALRTDPVSDRSRGKGFGEVGMADHLYIRYDEPAPFDPRCDKPIWAAPAKVMWIEFKRPGEKAKKHQQAWHRNERARGALTLIAGEDFPATVEGFREWYAGSGLARRIA